MEFINSIEDNFPVDKWAINSIHVWPLIRINGNWLNEKEVSNQTGKNNHTNKMFNHASYFASKIYSQIHFLRAYLKDSSKNQRIEDSFDAIFVSKSTQRRFFLNSGWYDMSCDPFIDYFESKGRHCFVLEFAPYSKYVIPRYRATRFVQPSFDLIPIISKFKIRGKNIDNLEGYSHLQKFLKKKGLSGYFPSKDYLIKTIALINTYKRFYLRVFSKVKPKIGFFVCYYGIKGMAFNLACREFGIPSVDIQHGVAGEFHRAYGKWNSIPQNGFELLPTFFWCWGKAEAESINKWRFKVDGHHMPIVGGYLGLWKWLNENTAFTKYREKAQEITRPDKINLLVTHQGIKLPKWFSEVINDSPQHYNWFVRLHPQPKRSTKNIDDIIMAGQNDNVDIKNATDLPLMALLERVDIHITLWSSTVLEAKQFGVPSIVIHENGQDLFGREIEDGTVKIAFSRRKFEEAVSSFKNQKVHPFLSRETTKSNKALSELFELIKTKK